MATELSKIDLNLLVLFEAVYSTGAIGSAAERLHLTQPAVSMGLKRLRELVDDPLFARAGRGVSRRAREVGGAARQGDRAGGQNLQWGLARGKSGWYKSGREGGAGIERP